MTADCWGHSIGMSTGQVRYALLQRDWEFTTSKVKLGIGSLQMIVVVHKASPE
jgi:hypothetical protein